MIRAGYYISSAPASEPITLAQAKLHLKIETADTDDDALITNLIKSARMSAEKFTRLQLMTATYEMHLDGWYDEILINRSPIQSISNIKYYDEDNVLQTLGTSIYDTDIIWEPARITRAENATWPELKVRTNAVKITFVAGFTSADNVPRPIYQAMLMAIGHFYEHRQDVVIGRQVNELPKNSTYLLEPYKVFCFK